MNDYLAWSGVLIVATSCLCSLAAFFSKPSSFLKLTWGFVSLAVGLWGAGLFKAYIARDYQDALFWLRFLNVFAITIPVFFLHFVVLLTRDFDKRIRDVLAYYIIAAVFVWMSLLKPEFFIPSVSPKGGFSFYPDPGVLFYFFFLLFSFGVGYGLYLLIRFIPRASPVLAMQARYVLLGTAIGFSGGATTFFLVFNIPLLPFGVGFVVFYVFFVTYAILRYRVMDIRVAVTSVGIFVVVYAMTLGAPFYLYMTGSPFLALLLAIFLATVAPFAYSHLRIQAENNILLQEKTYQDILLRAAQGLTRYKTVDGVTGFLVELFSKVIEIKNAAVYMRQETSFGLLDSVGGEGAYAKTIPFDAPLVGYLEMKGVLFLEERKSVQHGRFGVFRNLVDHFKLYPAIVAVPVSRNRKLLGILFLGEKSSGATYSERDITVLNLIADQAALAIENCQYLQAEAERIKEEGAAARREYLDTMVACMAHEIDNPMTVIIGQAGLLKEILPRVGEEVSCRFLQEIDVSLGHMNDAALRVSGIIKRVEEFAKGGAGKSEPTDIYDVLEGYRVIKGLSKKKWTDVRYEEDIEPGLPQVLAEKVLLEEVLINFIENAYHAVTRNQGSKDVLLKVFRADTDFVRILCEDNGCGMSRETLRKIFEVPTTTKGSSEGTGLGLYRVRQICDVLGAHRGARSDGAGKGACVWIDLKVL